MLKQIITISGISLLLACNAQVSPNDAPTKAQNTVKKDGLSFVENKNQAIVLDTLKRRKWGGPVISDLDQDGNPDIILTNHGDTLEVYWNLGGTFSKPEVLLSSDVHGVATADFDKDGKMEIVIAQGGGDGKRPKFPLLFEVSKNRKITKQPSMDHFEFTRGRAAAFIDADNDGMLEMITTAFPLKSQKEGANHFYKFNKNKEIFEFSQLLQQAQWMGFRLQTLDFNNDGDKDIIFYGGANLVALAGRKDKSFEVVTNEVLGPLQRTKLVQSISEIDFDNDGDEDLFLARAQHQFYHQTFHDKEERLFAFFTFKNKGHEYELTLDEDLFIENLQLTFPDYKIFLGSDKRIFKLEGDLHGHRDLNIEKEQAQGWPADTSEFGIYIGHLGKHAKGGENWKIKINTRSRNTGVVHNVISAPATEALESLPAMLLENVGNKYVDATQKLSINIPDQTTGSAVADYNNDGYQDIFVTRYGDMTAQNQQVLLLNQGGKTFKQVNDHALISKERGATGSGASAFDYDLDGDIDIMYASERGLWHLFTNELSPQKDANYVGVRVGHSKESNIDPLDTVVTIKACGKKQTQTIGNSGLAFSQGLNTQVHFGLGQCESVDSITIKWRNGERRTITSPKINRYLSL